MFLMLSVFLKSLVDLIMVNLCVKRKRNLYSRYKYIESDDFSDLKEGLEPVKREREEQTRKNDIFN